MPATSSLVNGFERLVDRVIEVAITPEVNVCCKSQAMTDLMDKRSKELFTEAWPSCSDPGGSSRPI